MNDRLPLAELGLEAEILQHFRNWRSGLRALIALVTPVVALIRFRKGEVKGFLYESTAGHLIVIRGFKPNGDVIVNDPARREKGNGVVYQASEMAKAWFDNGGVGYVIRKPTTSDSPLVQGRRIYAPQQKAGHKRWQFREELVTENCA